MKRYDLPSGTRSVYVSILRQFLRWVAERTKKGEAFQPDLLSTRAIEHYLVCLASQGYSFAHCKRVKSVINHFCQWLVDERSVLALISVRVVQFVTSPISI